MSKQNRPKYNSALRTFTIITGIILIWRGFWSLADILLFPENPLASAVTSLAIGTAILFMATQSFEDLL